MNDMEPDSVQISLGDAIKQLKSSENEEVEKIRIHLLLLDENSEASRRTWKWCRSNKEFKKYSLARIKEINGGFLPKHQKFKQKSYNLTIKKMDHDFHCAGWYFYELAYIEYLLKEKKELSKLLELEESKGLTESNDLIKAVIEKAPKYKVTADDINDLYKHWYFKQNNDFNQWIQELKGIGRSLENQRHIDQIESELDNLKKELVGIRGNVEKYKEVKDSLKLLKLQVKELKNHLSEDLKGLTIESKNQITYRKELSEKIIQLESGEKAFTVEFNTLKSSLKKLISTSHDYVDEQFNTLEGKYENELSELSQALDQKIHMLDIDVPQESIINQLSSDFKQKNKTILRADKSLAETHIEEEQFLVNYRRLLELSALGTTNKISALNHCILKCSDVICCQSLDIVDPWIRTLNWEQHVLEAAVDPNWTNYLAWQDVAVEFLSNPNIRLLILHSYNSGYIEGYLKPFLLLFRREHHILKKIILVEAYGLPKSSPLGLGLALIENHKRKTFKVSNETLEQTNPVSLKSIKKWTAIKNEEYKDHAQSICQNLIEFMGNENINIQKIEIEGLYHVLYAYISSGLALDQKTKNLLLTTFLSNLWEEEFVNKFIQEM